VIVKGFKNIFQKHPQLKGILKGPSLRKNERNYKGKFSLKDNTDQKSGHMIKDCPDIKRKNKRTKFKSKEADKRAMVTT